MGPDEMMKKFKECKNTELQRKKDILVQRPHEADENKRAAALRKQLTDDEKDFMQYLVSALPPIIGRSEVDRYLPGLIKPQTLAHADSAGFGPEVAWKVGRKVAYRTDSLVLWLIGRFGGVSRMVELNKFFKLSS